jgi:hypothetical protein
MEWTIRPFAEANHNPVVVVNGQLGSGPIFVDTEVGQTVTLDASETHDPDSHQTLTYSWFLYQEANSGDGRGLAAVDLKASNTSKTTVTATATCRPMWLQFPGFKCPAEGVAHVILAVTDNGSPSLTSYRRIVLTVRTTK